MIGSFRLSPHTPKFDVERYLDHKGRDVFGEWLDVLPDAKAKAAILRRINRLALGNPGDCKLLREGIRELRIDVGPGYRVYYAQKDDATMLILCGGDKQGQDMDIENACDYWREYQLSIMAMNGRGGGHERHVP